MLGIDDEILQALLEYKRLLWRERLENDIASSGGVQNKEPIHGPNDAPIVIEEAREDADDSGDELPPAYEDVVDEAGPPIYEELVNEDPEDGDDSEDEDEDSEDGDDSEEDEESDDSGDEDADPEDWENGEDAVKRHCLFRDLGVDR